MRLLRKVTSQIAHSNVRYVTPKVDDPSGDPKCPYINDE